MENNGTKGVSPQPLIKQSDETMNQELINHLALLRDAIDSPRILFIFRNAILTLLQLPNQPFNWHDVYALLRQNEFRINVVSRLKKLTPAYWSEEWDSLWNLDVDPLFSKAQQRTVRQHSLIVYWSEEWSSIPEELRMHALKLVEGIM